MAYGSQADPLFIDDALCQLCRRCLVAKACKGMAIIRFDREEAPVIDAARCRYCYACVDACPFHAVIRDKGRPM